MKTTLKTIKREARKRRIRSKVIGSSERPRVSVFRSNKYFYAQIIDDKKGATLASLDGRNLKVKGKGAQAEAVGVELGKMAAAKNIKKIVFDRGGYIFTGRVKTFAEALRKSGLEF